MQERYGVRLRRSKGIDIGTRCVAVDKGRILVQRGDGGFYRLPGGRLENVESLEGCIERELWEELGVEVKGKRLLYVVENMFIYRGSLKHEILFCYMCEIEGELKPRESHIRVSWALPEEVRDNFKPKPLIDEIVADMASKRFEPKYLLMVNDTLVRRVRIGSLSRTPGLHLRL